ncbi:MAG: amidohydrolase family protein [Steroidobacteraceae bacterium]
MVAVVVEGWFDGERRHEAGPTTMVVEDGVVTSIESADLGDALVARGVEVERASYLVPGLVDAHVHLFLDGGSTDGAERSSHLKQPVEILTETARRSAHAALGCGVTLVRDAGDRHGINHAMRVEARRHPERLAQVRSGGIGIKRPKRYGAFMAIDVEDEADITRSVEQLAASNDEIKLLLTGIIDFNLGAVTEPPQFTAAEARLVVEEARRHGRNVFAHCSGVEGLRAAVEAGVGSIEHGFFMSRSILEIMAEKRIAWTPTFSPVHFQWAHPQAVGWSPQAVSHLRRILDDHAEHLLLAHRLGVRLLLGTDAGSMGVEHGRAVLEEMKRFREAGLPMEAILAAATADARRHFDIAAARLAKGVRFDAVLLDCSPFETADALRQPRAVWSAGSRVR